MQAPMDKCSVNFTYGPTGVLTLFNASGYTAREVQDIFNLVRHGMYLPNFGLSSLTSSHPMPSPARANLPNPPASLTTGARAPSISEHVAGEETVDFSEVFNRTPVRPTASSSSEPSAVDLYVTPCGSPQKTAVVPDTPQQEERGEPPMTDPLKVVVRSASDLDINKRIEAVVPDSTHPSPQKTGDAHLLLSPGRESFMGGEAGVRTRAGAPKPSRESEDESDDDDDDEEEVASLSPSPVRKRTRVGGFTMTISRSSRSCVSASNDEHFWGKAIDLPGAILRDGFLDKPTHITNVIAACRDVDPSEEAAVTAEEFKDFMKKSSLFEWKGKFAEHGGMCLRWKREAEYIKILENVNLGGGCMNTPLALFSPDVHHIRKTIFFLLLGRLRHSYTEEQNPKVHGFSGALGNLYLLNKHCPKIEVEIMDPRDTMPRTHERRIFGVYNIGEGKVTLRFQRQGFHVIDIPAGSMMLYDEKEKLLEVEMNQATKSFQWVLFLHYKLHYDTKQEESIELKQFETGYFPHPRVYRPSGHYHDGLTYPMRHEKIPNELLRSKDLIIREAYELRESDHFYAGWCFAVSKNPWVNDHLLQNRTALLGCPEYFQVNALADSP